MAHRPWIVMPHGPLREIDDGLWIVESVVPNIPGQRFPRTMSVVRLADGSLLLHNAVPVDEPTMAAIERLGHVAVLLLPSAFHTIDAHAMAVRTGARVLAPAAGRAEIDASIRTDGDFSALRADPHVRMEPLDGVRNGEGVLSVERGGRVSYLVCDVILAVPHLPGFWGFVWRVAGFTGSPGPSPLWRRRILKDREALRAHLRRLADRPGLARLVPSHGPVIEGDVPALLRDVAARL
jgi:hypothetical protein